MNINEINNYIGKINYTLVEAMEKIDQNGRGILFITDDRNRLISTLTDGDIRKWLIKTGDLNAKVGEIARSNPRYINVKDYIDIATCNNFMEMEKITAVPIVDYEFNIIDIVFKLYTDEIQLKRNQLRNIPVIIMAGGMGTRLYPYTKILPKPLIPIGEVPVIERIMNQFNEYGAEDFYVTVNYKKGMIKSYFSESSHQFDINYIEEEKPLGTAGSIGLIDSITAHSVIVTNCDIIVEEDYGRIISHHKDSNNDMTVIASLRNVTIPYGILNVKGEGRVISIEEKPRLSYLINTGMYVVNTDCFSMIPPDKVYHMTDLTEDMISAGMKVGMYPISENSFFDMGQFEEMRKMEEWINYGDTRK